MEKVARRVSSLVPIVRSSKDSDDQFDLSELSLNREVDRRKTFFDNNWDNQDVSSTKLALLGFYFFQKPDSVRCHFCDIALSDFSPDDDILKEHLKFSPNCPLIRRRDTSNEPIDSEELDRILPAASIDECGSRRRKKSRVEDDVSYPEYRLLSTRLNSFKTWPKSMKQKAKDLSEAGFFYSGNSDHTVCFACGTFVGQWETDDKPWVEHKKFMERECSYLHLNHEQVKINERKYEELMKSKDPLEENTNDDDSEAEIAHENACKVCLLKRSSIVFLPCKHVAVCGECAFGLDGKCPVCRSEIKEMIPLYYA